MYVCAPQSAQCLVPQRPALNSLGLELQKVVSYNVGVWNWMNLHPLQEQQMLLYKLSYFSSPPNFVCSLRESG